jgi:hypothetical protein
MVTIKEEIGKNGKTLLIRDYIHLKDLADPLSGV